SGPAHRGRAGLRARVGRLVHVLSSGCGFGHEHVGHAVIARAVPAATAPASTGTVATRAQLARAELTDAGGRSLDGRGASIAIIDTGIDPTHPAFRLRGGGRKVAAVLSAEACVIDGEE